MSSSSGRRSSRSVLVTRRGLSSASLRVPSTGSARGTSGSRMAQSHHAIASRNRIKGERRVDRTGAGGMLWPGWHYTWIVPDRRKMGAVESIDLDPKINGPGVKWRIEEGNMQITWKVAAAVVFLPAAL